ncbi:lipocalin-like domain-containing protein [Hymenobacter glaciei]|uniref:Lipocalin-like domain-containing protein n=1 Tax=Hymenobacter glaciei TaxID=877209 RepID=A0ABP7USL8_9BACT
MKVLRFALLCLLAACAAPRPTTRFNPTAQRAELPHEEAPHPKNSLEWWYLTGHLRDQATGESFGVEYVFFHFNLKDGKQDWQMVNVALTDPQGQQFHYDYDLGKLPRLLTDSLPVRLRERKAGQVWTFDGQEGAYHLQAALTGKANAGYALDLTTRPTRPVVLHSGTGYENYGNGITAGYYSYPRLATTGTLTIGGKTRQVAGELWYDRQWNCTSIVDKNVGWDWLSIQLDEPREEFMLNTLRNSATGLQLNNGTLSRPTGGDLHLSGPDFTLTPLTYWTSPKSKRKYPATWRVQVPAQGYDLTVEPLVPQQELALRFFHAFTMYYWEGMCRVKGTRNGKPVTGQAYVEITNR